jgi:hypothetical protein
VRVDAGVEEPHDKATHHQTLAPSSVGGDGARAGQHCGDLVEDVAGNAAHGGRHLLQGAVAVGLRRCFHGPPSVVPLV